MPKKRTIIDTSLAAFNALDQAQVSETKRQILEVLRIMNLGSSEQIADALKRPYDVIWKRCSDLKNEGKIYATDSKVLTRRGRFARQWAISGTTPPEK